MSTYLSFSYKYVLAVSLLVSVSLSWWSNFIFLFIAIHSLRNNCIYEKGAMAISEAMKTMTNLQQLE